MDEGSGTMALPAPTGGDASGLLDVRILGPVQVSRSGEVLRLGGPKQLTVLGLLVAAVGRSVSVDALTVGVWGEDPPQAARSTLQSYVSNLRRALGDVIVWEGQGYRLDIPREGVDAWRFEDLVSAARQLAATSPADAVSRLRQALELWRGSPYAGAVGCAELEAEARRLEELRLDAVADRIDAELAQGHHADLVAELEALSASEPLRERFCEQRMLALYRSGRQADALRVYEQARALLVRELGIEPSPGLRSLHQRVLEQDAALELPLPGRTQRLALLVTEIDDAERLWEQDGGAMGASVEQYARILTDAVEGSDGRITTAEGDMIEATFADVQEAAAAAAAAQRAIEVSSWGELGELRSRMAIDVGEVQVRPEGVEGPVIERLSRLVAAGHGGQVLLSAVAHEELQTTGSVATTDLGVVTFRGVSRPERVFQLFVDGLPTDLPALRTERPRPPRATPLRTSRGYELHAQLGEGDFGAVYRAYQTSVGRTVAVKVIRPEYASQPVFIRRFEAEAQFVAQLEHPHVVALYDYWRDPDGAYLVMPLLSGGSLADALRRGPWNLGPALRLLEQVGSALAYAHRNGIVHRDVKPGNVLLDEDGNAYLSDFGIASRVTDAAGGLLTSSLAYLAPEELRGEPLTSSSDIFAIGVMVLELLTGVRPTGRELPVLTDVRPDLPAELDEVVARATDDDPARRYDRVEDLLRALRQAAGADVVAVASPQPSASASPVRNPYKGLRAFQETDAADFYGRDTVVDELLQALAHHRLIGVVGPSGSGKSSLVRAGLVPALRAGGLPGSRGWLITSMYPGSYPFEELETALLRVAVDDPGGLRDELRSDDRGLLRVVKRILPRDDSELVLVIDQFEELFSLVDDEATRRQFLAALEVLITDERSRVRVIATLRADFFDRPLDHPSFGELFKTTLVPVTPPSAESLGLAISRPARSVGLDLEPGLVGEIIADVQDEPGGLPLLQYALTELFQQREDDQLTIAAYRRTGGVIGALSTRAEELYQGLSPGGKAAARQLFLRLVTVDEETDDTRRRVSQLELEGLDVDREQLDTVLQQYASYRLLTYDRDPTTRVPTVEVAHEALLREWDRLRGWIGDQRETLIFHRRLTASMRDWLDADRDPSFLLRGGRLEQAEAWAESSDLVLSSEEEAFLAASRDARAEEEAAARRRRRRVTIGLIAALLIVSLLALMALQQRQAAGVEARVATARALAASALANLDVDPERSILLALEAVKQTRSLDGTVLPEAEAALREAVSASRVVSTIPHGDAVISDDGTQLATLGPDGLLTIWDPRSGTALTQFDGSGEDEWLVASSAELGLVVTGQSFEEVVPFSAELGLPATILADELLVWDVTASEVRHVLRGHHGGIHDAAFSPDGRWLATAGRDDGTVRVWNTSSGLEELVLRHPDAIEVSVGFNADGTRLAAAGLSSTDDGGAAWVWDLETQAISTVFPPEEWAFTGIAFDPSGERVATVTVSGFLAIHDADTGTQLVRSSLHAILDSVAFDPDGARVATGSSDGTSHLWDAATGSQLQALPGHTHGVPRLAFTPDGTHLATTSFDGTSRLWDVSAARDPNWLTVPAAERIYVGVEFSPDGTRFAAPAEPSGVTIWDAATGQELITLTGYDAKLTTVAFSPDGRLLAAGSDQTLTPPVWDVETGELLFTLDGHTGTVRAVAFSPDGRRLVTGGSDAARIWDAVTGEELGSVELGPGDGPALAVAFTADGSYLVTGGPYGDPGAWGKVTLWDAHTFEEVRMIDAHPMAVTGLALGPDGVLATASSDATAKLWDLESGEELLILRGHDAPVFQVAISPDGSRIATASADGTARVWDAATGRELLTLTPHDALVYGVAFSPDGRLLATASPDGTVALHLLPIDEFVDLARTRVTRELTVDECRRYLNLERCPEG
jgi:WD40 repeat protein/DNA-binding SARP family transcriptional activator